MTPLRLRIAPIAAVACGVAVLLNTTATAALPAPGPAGRFDASPAGYLGCVATLDASHTYCFETHIDAQSGTVEVVTSSTDAAGNASTTTGIVSPGAVSVVGGDVVLDVVVPNVGGVNIDAHSYAVAGLTGDDVTCPLYPVVYALSSETSSVYGASSVTGTVAGQDVQATNRCGAYFVGPTTGLWSMPLAAT